MVKGYRTNGGQKVDDLYESVFVWRERDIGTEMTWCVM